jgi:hypothetical protein
MSLIRYFVRLTLPWDLARDTAQRLKLFGRRLRQGRVSIIRAGVTGRSTADVDIVELLLIGSRDDAGLTNGGGIGQIVKHRTTTHDGGGGKLYASGW